MLPDEASDKSSESSPASLVNAIDQSSEDHEAEHLPPSRESPGNKLPTFRLWFYKLEQASLISHLEMLGVFERAARRARLPVAYSNGFHPKSRLRFSPALSLGAESRCEFLEIVLQQTIDLDEVIPRLQQQLPLGIELQRGEWVESNILHKICGIHWRFILDTSIVNAFNRVQKLLEQGTLIIPRQGKEPLDIGPRLIDLSLQDQTSFDIICRFDHQGTVRPIDLLEGLFQLDETAKQSARIIRLDWILS
jgi:radical SAM-linked protein